MYAFVLFSTAIYSKNRQDNRYFGHIIDKSIWFYPLRISEYLEYFFMDCILLMLKISENKQINKLKLNFEICYYCKFISNPCSLSVSLLGKQIFGKT